MVISSISSVLTTSNVTTTLCPGPPAPVVDMFPFSVVLLVGPTVIVVKVMAVMLLVVGCRGVKDEAVGVVGRGLGVVLLLSLVNGLKVRALRDLRARVEVVLVRCPVRALRIRFVRLEGLVLNADLLRRVGTPRGGTPTRLLSGKIVRACLLLRPLLFAHLPVTFAFPS